MNIDLLKLELTRDEGVRLRPYKDTVGRLTLGIGRNLDDVGISADEADFMLSNDLNERVLPGLRKNLPWYSTLNESRQRVLANMAFNLGIDGLLKFRNMLAAAQGGDYNLAANEMLNSPWAKQVGDRAKRLADMMRSG